MYKLAFGMPTLIENSTIDDNIALCRELGLEFIELNMNFPEYQLDTLENRDFQQNLKNSELLYTIHLDENLDIADFNPLVSEAYFETVRRTIAAAKVIGAPVINMHMNHGIHITLPDRKVQMYERDFDTYFAAFQKFRDMCEREIGGCDIKITIENTEGYREYEKKAVEYLLESPVFALTWDIGHSKAADEIDVPFIMAHEEHLYHFHIHDAEGSHNHLALGDGCIDLEARLDCAEKHGCRCVLETKTVEALRKTVRWLDEYGYGEV